MTALSGNYEHYEKTNCFIKHTMTALGPTYWPAEWRKSQTLFNFLAWLKEKKGYRSELRCRDGRMADPFYITDKKWDKLYLEYMKSLRDKELLK